MWRRRLAEALAVVWLTACAHVSQTAAQETPAPGALLEAPLPGGLGAAMRAAGDPAALDRSYFLLDIIRGSQNGPTPQRNERKVALKALVQHLEAVGAATVAMPPDARVATRETVPLPLPPSVWIEAVFGGRASLDGLVAAILRSPEASLLYCGLLSLDDATRVWLAAHPELVSDLVGRHGGPFVVAAPALRVTGGAVRVPGGAAGDAGWESLLGTRVTDPPGFIRALLSKDEGRLAYMFGAMARLTPGQLRFALHLDAPEARDRIAAMQRVRAMFDRVTLGWDVHKRPFWQPGADPALFLSDFRVDGQGRPVVPGTRRFWELAFGDSAPRIAALTPSELLEGSPVDFSWLCEQVFDRGPEVRSQRYLMVLFASRLAPSVSRQNAVESLEAVRAVRAYPALIAALERTRLADPLVMARAARRAAQLSDIKDERRAIRSLSQYQGVLALLVRAASQGAITRDALPELVASLSDVSPGETGDYEGNLVRWIATRLSVLAPGPLDEGLLALAAGRTPLTATYIDWEGTRYQVDLARGETMRISRLLGEQPRPYLSSAVALVATADAVQDPSRGPSALRSVPGELARVADAVGWADGAGWPEDVLDRSRGLAAHVERAPSTDTDGRHVLARALGVLADDLLARGIGALAYAAALGQSDRSWLTAGDVSSGHDFGIRPAFGRSAAWDLPTHRVNGVRAGFAITGALLGLDVPLADLSLQRVSVRPPPRRPMLSDANRRGFLEAVTFVEPALLTDQGQDAIVSAIGVGRERVVAVRSREDAAALAETLRLDPARASLFAWAAASDRTHLEAFLAPGELLWIGLGAVPHDSLLHGWGAPVRARTGCLCLRLPAPQPWNAVAGRSSPGLLASLFPDLHLRLAELLAQAGMPASLLGPVLASATLDFVNSVISRDDDDRRGMLQFVRELDADRLERYLALLTTDGPLVPLDIGAAAASTELRP